MIGIIKLISTALFPWRYLFVRELRDSLVLQCICYIYLLSYLLSPIFQALLASASGQKKKMFILLFKWYIIGSVTFWDAHNTFLGFKDKCASISSHSDNIVRKWADKLCLDHSQCQMFLAIFCTEHLTDIF